MRIFPSHQQHAGSTSVQRLRRSDGSCCDPFVVTIPNNTTTWGGFGWLGGPVPLVILFCPLVLNATVRRNFPIMLATADYYADPIPSFKFWCGLSLVQNRNRLLVRRWCSGHLFFACVIQQLGFWTRKIQASVDYCYVRRRAECTSLGPGLKHPSLCSDSSLAAKRRAEALHVVFLFNKASEPSTRAAAVCVFSHDA